jgi:hypothetical protein
MLRFSRKSGVGAEGGSRSRRFAQLAVLSVFFSVGGRLRGKIE